MTLTISIFAIKAVFIFCARETKRDNADAERASEIERSGKREKKERELEGKKREATPRKSSGARREKESGVEASASSYREK